MSSSHSPTEWDRHAIKAEVHRRGMTLTGIAVDAGLHPSTCRQGLLGCNRRGAIAIADALGIPFEELFPTSYTLGRAHKQKGTPGASAAGRAKGSAAADAREDAA